MRVNVRAACGLILLSLLAVSASNARADWADGFKFSPEPEGTAPLIPTEFAVDQAPRWTVWAGAIFLQRSDPSSQNLASDPGGPILNANDLHFNTQAGPDINAIRHGENFDLDFRFFHVDPMTASKSVLPVGSAQLDLANPFPLGAIELDTVYTTSLDSAEINFRHNYTERLTFLAGFRHVSLRDRLEHQFDLPVLGEHRVQLEGLNRLYGAQLGVDAIVLNVGRFSLQTAGKAGIYGNTASNGFKVQVIGDLDLSSQKRATDTAFVGDWNFNGVYQLTRHWAVRGGYQLLWISGVALASEQYPQVSHQFLPNPKVITDGDLFLHGALVSLQANW